MTHNEVIKQFNNILCNIISGKQFDTSQYISSFDIDNLNDEGLKDLYSSIIKLADSHNEASIYAIELSKGNLEVEIPKNNFWYSPYKQLHSNLNHLVWQIQRISEGDYNQRIDFLGDLSLYFNTMIESLKEKNEIEIALKQSEVKLKELNNTKDKFFSIIAHDLVNPFHAMILYSKELKSFTAGNERAASYNSNLLITAQNTYTLLQNLLVWARTQTKQVSFNPQLINISDIITENVFNAKNIAQTKQIEIKNEVNHEILIEADLQMINLILRNLISNSIKFSFNQGYVKILSKEDDNQISISVVDKGCGIEAHEINKLFNQFESTQRPGTTGEAGTGLGLIICKEFVSYHRGNIQVESEAGNGCTFTVTLPKKQNEA